ncbi:SDR family NAD(P)-dependent oxidoreductase [Salibacterium aidingense]|uniref:SDR family NAD(P)-dependent oxidoreductase n=1 Tax=Salibacterium aidingense TaxID=384933 RepID=UPI0003F6EF1A|nr:SDR family NAD(P)-dependent oxidoreductase [Salibacterium aidingense]
MGDCAIVTGSNGGFGQVITAKLLSMNYEVIATVRERERGQVLVDQATQIGKGDKLHLWEMDVTEPSHIEELKQYLLSEKKQVVVLVNNSGYCQAGMVEGVTDQQWREQFDVNFFGVVSLTKALLPMFRSQRSGSIINISSVSGFLGFPGMGAYAGSKFALEGFSESLRYEMLPFHIYVSLIEPGSYQTRIWEKALKHAAETEGDYKTMMANLQKEALQAAENSTAPEKIAEVVEKILRAKRPNLRYRLGTSAAMLHGLKQTMPARWLEKIIVSRLLR